MKITVFLADDHAMVRDGLQLLLENSGDIEVIGQAGSGRETAKEVPRIKPDVVLMDIAMPELNGIEASEQIVIDLTPTRQPPDDNAPPVICGVEVVQED